MTCLQFQLQAGKHCIVVNIGIVKFKAEVTAHCYFEQAAVLLKHKDGCSSLPSAGIRIRLLAGLHHFSTARPL